MPEQWSRWEPLQGLASGYYVDAILNRVERTVYKDPLPFRDSPNESGCLRDILLNSVLAQELSHEFFILLSEANNSQNQVLITFDDSSICYRSIAEKHRHEFMSKLEKEYGACFFNWTFFKVENSPYLTWLSDQSYEIINSNSLHFSFVARNLTLDVVSLDEPIVKIISE